MTVFQILVLVDAGVHLLSTHHFGLNPPFSKSLATFIWIFGLENGLRHEFAIRRWPCQRRVEITSSGMHEQLVAALKK